MPLLSAIGGLTFVTVALLWAIVKLGLNQPQLLATAVSAYKAFIIAWLTYAFLPGFAHAINSIAGFLAGVLL